MYCQDAVNSCYSFSQPFVENETGLFKGVEVTLFLIYTDTTQTTEITDILTSTSDLKWEPADVIKPKRDNVYWLKTRMAGHPAFDGRQVLHVADRLGNDLHAYNYIDSYVIDKYGNQTTQQVGIQIPPEDRPIEFWANYIQIEVPSNDTLDVYIRLKGLNLYYPLESIKLWHLDFDSVLSKQIYIAKKSFLFYGVLGIQIMFFILLYFIEREKIYISFSIFGAGLFLTRAFAMFNFSSLVPFPSLIPYNTLLHHSSVYLTISGGLLFISEFLSIPRDGKFMKRVIPLYLLMTLIAYLRFIFRYSFSDTGSYPALLTPAAYTNMALLLGIYMICTAPSSSKNSKLFLLLAIMPIVIGTILTTTYNEGWLTGYVNAMFIDDFMKGAVVSLIFTLALTVGYRSQASKLEKESAIKENIKAQQIIFEKQMRTEKLEEMDAIKTRLYTNITHEFRTPLTVIMGINDELTETTRSLNLPEDKKNNIIQNQQLIHRNSENLLSLVNQFLDLSKSESEQLDLKLIHGDIIVYLNYLVESFLSQANDKNIRLVFYSEIPFLLMDYDEIKIQHVVYNLLSNALKFTTEHGKIVMHAAKINQSLLQLKIKDDGIGIPANELNYIFDRFYQVDNLNSRNVDGSGIGLSLTKDIIQLMGGEINVESTEGEGSTFTIIIPITNEAAIVDVVRPTMNILPESEEKNRSVQAIPSKAEDKPILLIVEDNRDVINYLVQVLGQSYHVIEAINGVQGIDKAIEIIPDLIISDVMMPVKDGYELTRVLKKDQRTSHIPIILLTAKAAKKNKLEGLKIGADAYLSKPFNKEELLIRINKLLEIRNVLRAKYVTMYSSVDGSTTIAQSATIQAPEDQSKEEQFLATLRDIVIKEIKNDSLNSYYLSNQISISQSQLYRKIKALTGETPTTFIRDIRLKKSLSLLHSDEYNISQVAYEVGFSNPSYYSRAFQKKYGKSPRQYRKG